MYTHTRTMIDPWPTFNIILVISNIAYVIPAIACMRYKRYLSALVWLATGIHSTIYHACKWGPYDKKGFGGYCISENMTIEQYYLLDFFTTQMIIPVTTGFFINPKTAVCRVSSEKLEVLQKQQQQQTSTFLGDGYYRKVPKLTRRWLFDLETIYIVYHVLVISSAVKLVGPSITKLTLPLLTSNLLIILFLMIHSSAVRKQQQQQQQPRQLNNNDDDRKTHYFFHKHLFEVDHLKSLEWSLKIHDDDGWYDMIKNRKLNVVLMILFVFAAVLLFGLQDVVIPPNAYWLTHTLWHNFGPITAYILYTGVL